MAVNFINGPVGFVGAISSGELWDSTQDDELIGCNRSLDSMTPFRLGFVFNISSDVAVTKSIKVFWKLNGIPDSYQFSVDVKPGTHRLRLAPLKLSWKTGVYSDLSAVLL